MMNRKFFTAIVMISLSACGNSPSQPQAVNHYQSVWTKMAGPIISPTQTWEEDNINDGSVVLVGGTYYRFYCAGNSQMNIGYATSVPGQFPSTWTKSANNPVVRVGDLGNFKSMCAPRVIQMPDGTFRMYVHAFDGTHDRGFLFVSSNFPDVWTPANGGNPIFTEGAAGQWDSYQIQTQAIVPPWESPDGLWHMLYIGYDGSTFRGGHAISSDGISWVRDPANPIMSPDSGWKSQDVAPLGWYKIGGTYYIITQGYDGTEWSVGLYKTSDFYTFQPDAMPMLAGTAGSWDSSGIEGADFFRDTDGTMWTFYLGSDVYNAPSGGNQYRGGVAQITESQ